MIFAFPFMSRISPTELQRCAIIGLCRIPHGEECLLFALVCFHLTPAREIGQGGPFNDLKGISFSCNYSTEKFLKRSLRTDSIEDIA